MHLKSVLFAALALFLSFSSAVAQVPGEPDTARTALPEVRIEATRSTGTQSEAPLSVSVQTRDLDQILTEAPATLADIAPTVPGLWISERGHYAENERISVRGMGWRASFGVRGIQVFLDGVPLTMPDGQAVTEIIDPAFVERVEVLRGPGSLFWGNASGGVLHFSTPRSNGTGGLLRASGSSYGGRYYAGSISTGNDERRVFAFASSQERDGYRDYASGHRRRGAVTSHMAITPRTSVDVIAAFVDQSSDSPGSLTMAQVEQNPRMANQRNVDTHSGKASFQGQAAVVLTHLTHSGVLRATAFGLGRRLENSLPFEVFIPLERAAWGTRVSYQRAGTRLDWSTGFDFGFLSDERQNWTTENGIRTDVRLLDQVEQVQSAATYALLTYRPANDVSLTAGIRGDAIRFALDDRFLENGDQSGSHQFLALSPGIGASWQTGPATLYTSFTTAFETPTTTELVNRPDLTGGFNKDLQPQRVFGMEAGARGWAMPELTYDVALFHLTVLDQLEQFQTEEGGDRDFYRNGGTNVHRGIETALDWMPVQELHFRAAYTLANYRFEGREVDGNRVPGVPVHRGAVSADARYSRLRFRLTADGASSQYTNDVNSARADGYVLLDASLGVTGLRTGSVRWYPFADVSNLLDEEYIGSVNINAAGGRFYEPGTGRTLTVGISASF